MALLQRAVHADEDTSFRINLRDDSSYTSLIAKGVGDPWKSSVITHTPSGCTLSIDGPNGAENYSGTSNSRKCSYVLYAEANAETLEMSRLNAEYTFDAEASRSPSKPTKASPEDSEPDPDNPYDHRHYLNDVQINGIYSPLPSRASTPLLAPTPRASSPSIFQIDPPGGPRSRSDLGAASKERTGIPQMHDRRRHERTTAPMAMHGRQSPAAPTIGSSTAPPPTDRTEAFDGLIIEEDDDEKPPPKRQRMALIPNSGPISLTRATSTPAERSRVASPVPQHESAVQDDDVEDFELPAPVARRPDPPARRESMLDAEAVQGILDAFNEEDENQDATSEVQQSKENESESEEE